MNCQDLFNCPCCGKPYLFLMKSEFLPNCLDSNEDIINTNFNEETSNSIFDQKLKSLTRETTNISNNCAFSITNFNFIIEKKTTKNNIINNVEGEEEINVKDPKRLGRKTKRDVRTKSEDNNKKKKSEVHDKFYDDNMRKKCKNIILKYTLQFINEKIKEKYNGIIGIGEHKKELKILKQEDKIKSTVDIDKIFFEKTLKDIFSEEISSRFNGFLPTHNKTIIELLINESDDEKKEFFNKLFNLTFLDCLKCFRGDKVIIFITHRLN